MPRRKVHITCRNVRNAQVPTFAPVCLYFKRHRDITETCRNEEIKVAGSITILGIDNRFLNRSGVRMELMLRYLYAPLSYL